MLVFVLLLLQNKRRFSSENLKEDFDNDGEVSHVKRSKKIKDSKDVNDIQFEKRFKKIEDLSGTSLSKKNGSVKSYTKIEETDESMPSFPIYEIVDDEDLL